VHAQRIVAITDESDRGLIALAAWRLSAKSALAAFLPEQPPISLK
jgi:hypothetical protein